MNEPVPNGAGAKAPAADAAARTAARRVARAIASRVAAALLSLAACMLGALPAHALQAAAGDKHSLLVRDDGTLWAWGWNEYGQLGDGSLSTRPSPVPVMSGVRAAAGGEYHTVVLKTDGTVWAFGMGVFGQLGIGVVPRKAVPVQVMSGASAISAGYFHTIALKTDGTVWTWGENTRGQLGDGTTVQRSVPAQVMTGVVAIGSGFRRSMAIKTDGSLWVWGENGNGGVGDGTKVDRALPGQVLTNVASATGSYGHTLALRTDGSVWAWGLNDNKQVGNGSTADQLTPLQVQAGALAIAASGFFDSYSIKPGGELWHWGSGVGVPTLSSTGVASIAGGGGHVIVVKTDGSLEASGDNQYGQLGDGGVVDRSFPVLALTGVRAATGGSGHSMALKTDGSLWTWGSNEQGQLGNGESGSDAQRSVPAQVMAGVQSIASGQWFSMAITPGGNLFAWGVNSSGQYGDGTTTSSTTPKQLLANVRSAAGGYAHMLVVKTDGTLFAAGENGSGQLGDGSTTSRTSRVQIMTGVVDAAAQGSSSFALKSDGSLWAWGFNIHGEVGDGTQFARTSPVQIMTGVKAIAMGNLHGLALKTDGTVWAWGYSENGQVGDGTNSFRISPVQIMANVAMIAASYYRSAAIKTDGTVWGWGENSGWGGTSPNRPAQILSLRGATAIGAGYGHTMAVTAGGNLYAWGNNSSGQLGVPGAARSTVPVKVRDPNSVIAGSSVVWEFYNPLIVNGAGTQGAGHYFMTADAAEAAAIDSGAAGAGWVRTGRVFRAWLTKAAAPAGAAGVCRFYARGPNSHFYTADPGECAALKAANPTNSVNVGWAYESIAFYTVLPVLDLSPPPVGSIAFTAGTLRCGAGYQPVYRVYNNRFNPNPALNDSNHRITPSVGDAYRSKTFLGYTDEGIAFCSPTSDANEGGDYQAFYLYPGAEVAAAGALKTSYIFSNNGARRGDGALVYLILPAEVGNWTASCAGYNGATCPAALTVDALRAGQPLPAFPAGGFVVITVQGTAPVAPGANSYAAAIAAPSGAPDYLLSNNVPVVSQTVVKAPVICAWVLNPATLALPNSAQTAQTRIATNTSCRWSITADQPWLTGAPLNGTGQTDLSVSASANAGIAARSGTITLTGLNAQGQPIAASAATVRVVQTGTPATPVNAANPGCADSRVAREGDQFGSVGITGSSVVNLVVDTNCAWTSKSNAVWISVVKGSGGSGNAEVGFQVAENPGTEVRKGTVSIANRDFTVTQMGTSSNRSGSSGGCGGSTGGCGESGADGGGGGAGSGGDGGSSGGDSG